MEIRIKTPDFSDLESILDWKGFKSADEKYRALVSYSQGQEQALTEKTSDFFSSNKLSKAESEVFEIEANEIPALYWAYLRYQSLVGQNETYFGEFCDQERRDHAKYFRGLWEWSIEDAARFMSAVCELPRAKTTAWVCKDLAAQIRRGSFE